MKRWLTSIVKLGRHAGRPVRSDGIRLATGLRSGTGGEAAEWVGRGLLPWGQHHGTTVGAVIPGGFEAYARVLHPAAGKGGVPVAWREVADWSGRTVHPEVQWEAIVDPVEPVSRRQPWEQPPPMGCLPLEVRRRLVDPLRKETTRHDLCWVLVWEGWGGFEPHLAAPDAPRVLLPNREYVLFHAPLEVLAEGLILGPGGHEVAGPSMW